MRKLHLKDDYGLTLPGVMVVALTVITVLFWIIMVPVYFLDREICENKADAMNRDSRYGFFTGCMVETDDGYFPLDQVRENQ